MVDFLSKCLTKSCENRATAEDLLEHPWIKGIVNKIGQEGKI